jgi:hypothetical protein
MSTINGGGICGIFLSTWPYKLPTNETINTAATAAALHGEITSDAALGGDVHDYLHCAVYSFWQDKLTNSKDNKLQLMKPVLMCDSPLQLHQEVLLMCLLIRHTHPTYEHFFAR